ncbi:hypothetical protein PHAVU_011G163700 [Phaseolus vulgaris]|uniref:HMA domain-containing protein n=1 Tax=Phaseolus vulgaris TaxID=3885 RepID=V7AM75_PHAVU|nr:hypothetical protein PHAVU_011G163700g [Phaseolus vulgaris]ESW05236.1 hypothetical protein PHAVU_011G163700g [Phaseolus vulgaris]
MKKKVVIKLQMKCDKCRNNALKIAAQIPGVTSVALEGDDNDHVAVSGKNVDIVFLVNRLKKRFSSVVIVTVENLNTEAEGTEKKMLYAVQCKKCRSSSCHSKCDIDIMFCFK